MHKIAIILCFLFVYCMAKPSFATCIGLGCNCTLGVTAVAFGSYNPFIGTSTASNGNIQVTCSAAVIATVSYTVTFSTGNSGNYVNRYMVNGASHLLYNIYNAANGGSIYGDGTGGTVIINDGYVMPTLAPVVKNYVVFGIIPALQNLPVGSYSDSMTATLTF